MSSLAEVRQAIEKLAPKERAELRQCLDAQDIEESPEFPAAVDKGILYSLELEMTHQALAQLASDRTRIS
jgi:hypothetical protein